jgi:sulfonate transport system substrate-binding protein
VPIDAEVVAAEQRTIDLYLRNGLIQKPLKAADILDPSFNAAVLSGTQEAAAK